MIDSYLFVFSKRNYISRQILSKLVKSFKPAAKNDFDDIYEHT